MHNERVHLLCDVLLVNTSLGCSSLHKGLIGRIWHSSFHPTFHMRVLNERIPLLGAPCYTSVSWNECGIPLFISLFIYECTTREYLCWVLFVTQQSRRTNMASLVASHFSYCCISLFVWHTWYPFIHRAYMVYDIHGIPFHMTCMASLFTASLFLSHFWYEST